MDQGVGGGYKARLMIVCTHANNRIEKEGHFNAFLSKSSFLSSTSISSCDILHQFWSQWRFSFAGRSAGVYM